MFGVSVSERPLRLFISHSWDHDDHRDGLGSLIANEWPCGSSWVDLAIPKEHPLHVRGDIQLENALRQRIAQCDVLVAFAGLYSSRSNWIEFEVRTAYAQFKPILAVRPRAQDRLSQIVVQRANDEAGWNGASVRKAIKELIPPHVRADVLPGLLRGEYASRVRAAAAQRGLATMYRSPQPRYNALAQALLLDRYRP